MTIDTVVRRSLIQPRRMAVRAFQAAMRAAQRETRQGMFERRYVPELLRVALAALGLCTSVHVVLLVAHLAVFAHPAEPTVFDVALVTFQHVVDAREQEVFMEVARRVPAFLNVAL